MSLTALPEDILLEIACHLFVTDILSLKQTCRFLHAFGSTDYLWHMMTERIDLSLDIPPCVRSNTKSADELQALAIKALRLERNWIRPVPEVKRVKNVTASGPFVDSMQLLPGGNWLLTSQRSRRLINSRISLWSLSDVDNPHPVFGIDVTGAYRDSSIVLKEDRHLLMVLLLHDDGLREFLEIYAADLADRMHVMPVFRRRFTLPNYPGGIEARNIEDVSLSDEAFAATAAIFPMRDHMVDSVALANVHWNALKWLHPRFHEPFSILRAKLRNEHIYLTGKIRDIIAIRVYRLPSDVLSKTPAVSDDRSEENQFVDVGPLIAEYSDYDERISRPVDVIYTPASFTSSFALLFLLDDDRQVVGHVKRFPLGTSVDPRRNTNAVIRSSLRIPAATSIRLVQNGVAGRRVIWLESNIETGEFRLMKVQLGGLDGNSEVIQGVLIPPDAQLPFSLNMCHSLAFDEITGRICLGLYDGSIQILDFV